jgi:hypothetical protein
MARSRSPFVVVISGAFSSDWACFSDSQVPRANPDGLGALHALDAGGKLGRQQAVVGGLHRELADGRHADDDA